MSEEIKALETNIEDLKMIIEGLEENLNDRDEEIEKLESELDDIKKSIDDECYDIKMKNDKLLNNI